MRPSQALWATPIIRASAASVTPRAEHEPLLTEYRAASRVCLKHPAANWVTLVRFAL